MIVVCPECTVCGLDDGEVHMEKESGARQTRRMVSPIKPKPEDIEEHEQHTFPIVIGAGAAYEVEGARCRIKPTMKR